MIYNLFLTIFITLACANLIKCDPTVTLSQGELVGRVFTNENGVEYYGYLGVPYAKPPIRKLRFRPPQKAEPWDGVLNATQSGSICRSVNMLEKKLDGDEDCLFINIFTPKTSTSGRKLPVLFWIHGGGFIGGSGNYEFQGPDYLIEHDIIVVTFNYRLGPYGFLNLELEGAPGNVGLLDQVEALKWTKENIEKFGGDPDQITIDGVSAGGASVHYLLLSHTATGLFQRAIAQSGSALNPWALQRDPVKRALQLCEALGLPKNSTTEEALDFLQTAPVDSLLAVKLPSAVEGQLIDDFVFVPSVEKVFPTHQPFLEETPLARIKSGKFNKVPQIVGFNNAEGNMFTFFKKQKPDMLEQLDADFEKGLPTDLDLVRGSEASKKLAEKAKKFYFNDQPVATSDQQFAQMFGDDWFTRGINEQVKLTVEHQDEPVYYYEYSFAESNPIRKLFDENSTLVGACHGEEMPNILKIDIMPLEKDKPSVVLTQKRMLELWTNFIKTGNPTPEVTEIVPVKWEPATKENLYYLDIGTNLTLGTNPEEARVKFWENALNEISLEDKE